MCLMNVCQRMLPIWRALYHALLRRREPYYTVAATWALTIRQFMAIPSAWTRENWSDYKRRGLFNHDCISHMAFTDHGCRCHAARWASRRRSFRDLDRKSVV